MTCKLSVNRLHAVQRFGSITCNVASFDVAVCGEDVLFDHHCTRIHAAALVEEGLRVVGGPSKRRYDLGSWETRSATIPPSDAAARERERPAQHFLSHSIGVRARGGIIEKWRRGA